MPANTARISPIVVVIAMTLGCSDSPPIQVEPSSKPLTTEQGSEKKEHHEEHYWDAVFVSGVHVGHNHMVVKSRPVSVDDDLGQPLKKITLETVIELKRFGNETKQTMSIVSIEWANGKIKQMVTTMKSGQGETQSEISSNGTELVVVSRTAGTESRSTLSADCLGVLGYEPDLKKNPMRPGESRRYRQFIPFMNSIAPTELVAKQVEETPLLGGTRKLLRVESLLTMAGGNKIGVSLWTNDRGEVLKTDMNGLQTTYRTTKQNAIKGPAAGELEFGTQSLVRVAAPIETAHATFQVRYRVSMKRGDPNELFAKTELQTLRAIDDRTCELTVTRGGPKPSGKGEQASETVSSEFLTSSALIQSNDVSITKMAAEVRDGRSAWETACHLETFVHNLIAEKNFTTAFASAKEVAESKQGDCTEHSILLTALCRAKQIPSRCAIGLVYYQPEQAFAFHMWSEVWIEGHWYPLDATLALGGTGAAHIKVSDTSLADGGGMASMLPVIQLLGDLQIEVLAVSSSDED